MKKIILSVIMLISGCAYGQPIPQEMPYVERKVEKKNYLEVRNDAEYTKWRDKTVGKRVCYLFSASWCNPCKTFLPKFKNVADRNKHILFIKLDIDECPNAAKMNGVEEVPVVLIEGKLYPVGGTTEQKFESGVLTFYPKQ